MTPPGRRFYVDALWRVAASINEPGSPGKNSIQMQVSGRPPAARSIDQVRGMKVMLLDMAGGGGVVTESGALR